VRRDGSRDTVGDWCQERALRLGAALALPVVRASGPSDASVTPTMLASRATWKGRSQKPGMGAVTGGSVVASAGAV
jgi:hypothetical protein